MDLLNKLNNKQREAAKCIEGPLLILAGAGSGKTSVLTYRMAYLVSQGVSPFNIMALTFTNKAAREMKERVVSLVPKGDLIWVSTFHSSCVRILRRDIHNISYDNNFTIYDSDDSERLIKKCIRELNLNDKIYPAKTVKNEIGRQKDELISATDFEKKSITDFRLSQIAKVYNLYQKKLKENNALDFDDIIFKTVELFVLCPYVLEKYQDRFTYLMVDEYQDTNTAQYHLIKLLASKNNNICVVGDDDQSIYGWRGANIRNILDFEKDFKNAKAIKLEQNYRSTQNILNAANAVVSNNTRRKDKSLWTNNTQGNKIHYYIGMSDYEEASFIINKIKDKTKNGSTYGEFAILYRINALSRVLEETLIKNSIPYRLFGGVSFYNRKEIKDIIAYLKFIFNTSDNVALERIINVPKRGIGDTTVEKIINFATEQEMSFYKALEEAPKIVGSRGKKVLEFLELMEGLMNYAKDHTVFEVIEKILEKTNYIGEILIEDEEQAEDRIANIKELLSKAAEFVNSSEDKSLGAFLEDVSLVADIDNMKEGEETVVLMTIHSAKGLEFNYVFLAGFEEGIFPSYRSITSGIEKEIEEERRLCYVGITRAEKDLYITAANSRRQAGQIVFNSTSRFLEEIPNELIEDARFSSENTPRIEKTKKSFIDSTTFTPPKYEPKKVLERPVMPEPKFVKLNVAVGDKVKQMKYGVGTITDIRSAGADYEVTIFFEGIGNKKFMAGLSKITKV